MSHTPTPNASYSLTLRVRIQNRPGKLGEITTAIGHAGGDIEGIDIVSVGKDFLIRDITVNAASEAHSNEIVDSARVIDGVEVVHVSDRTFLMHLGGKIEITSKMQLKTRSDLSMAYTPGVARVCQAIEKDPEKVYNLTIKKNTVAVVSDGTAVLGLGDIGPAAAMPVMEGKCQLFKEFGGVDAFPICLNTKDPHEIIETIKNISVAFGGINLEDISAPRCFEIEDRLKEELDIPVFHDDQHGTAVVVLAALINALKIVGKKMEDVKVVVNGIGAAGVACSKIVMAAGVKNIIGCDTTGAIYNGRKENMNWVKDWYARNTNPENEKGTIHEVIKGADVFLGLSAPGVIDESDLAEMAKDPIVFAMANPTPEIMPEDAVGLVAVMATGRSDYPNQINNVLCFPGIFRGALNCRASRINEDMKLAAAHAIAEIIGPDELHPDYIIPSVFDRRVGEAVAARVEEAAYRTGVARRHRSAADSEF
ncbi:MAG TPA: malic enzyme-like NAD(P)-binding protein [Pyrinomonadaceae bacterium]|nr:NAD-dependent malic enzyme [Chloracidobacterium sp.]MBP9934686.1 NAD-dependent malic enzyme [Pyrinomonadaceae bacterium]MBK7804608.1 NAD-dependent malic enzyme [Chloracidobacterium sp.]MBK9439067.1 NAD-dependent malic enzyme [Chloracidobacterium sp.]MBL0240528.1 NAD-dependent malic enzyme [Chloracidobacterium sp.]